MRIFLLCLFGILFIFGCVGPSVQISYENNTQNDAGINLFSGDSCGGAGVPIDQLKSYCKEVNFQAVTLKDENGRLVLNGIENLELAGFNETDILTSAEYRCELIGDARSPDSYVECSAPLATVILDKNVDSPDMRQIIIWYLTFDPATKKLETVDCWCDQKGQGLP